MNKLYILVIISLIILCGLVAFNHPVKSPVYVAGEVKTSETHSLGGINTTKKFSFCHDGKRNPLPLSDCMKK